MSLIEMLIIIALIGVVSSAVLLILSSIYQGAIRTSAQIEQTAQAEQLLGGVSSLASRVVPAEIGPGGPLPAAALSGDQFMFRKGGQCFRIFHRAAQRDIWAAVALSGSCDQLSGPEGLLRGPSEEGFDPVLSALATATERVVVPESFVAYPLAEGVVALNDENGDPLPIFSYLAPDLSPIPVDLQGNSGSPVFSSTPNLAALEVQFAVLADPDLPPEQQTLSTKSYQQSIFIGQACPQ